MVRSIVLQFLLPLILMGVQMQSHQAQHSEEPPFWGNMVNADVDDARFFNVQTRGGGLDSLGRGNILRSLNGMGNDWNDPKTLAWRFNSYGVPKRGGGGLDSLGRGNILRRSVGSTYDDFYGRSSSLDSLGKGNILKRSV